MTTHSMTRRTWLIPAMLLLAVAADRLELPVSTGGRGVLPLLDLIAPPIALATVAAYGVPRSLRFASNPIFVLGVLPFIALTAILPVLGVMVYAFPVRTLLSATGFTTPLCLLIIGAALSSRRAADWALWFFAAIVIQFGYALAQADFLAHGPGWELFGPLHDWDLSLQALDGVLVQARSSGLYFNPNELGLWAGMAAIVGWWILPARLRVAGVTLAIGTLLLSQSRGATVALVAAGAVAVVLAVTAGHLSARRAIRTAASLGVIAVFIAVIVSAVGLPTDAVQRFSSLLAVLTQGPQADANLAGRIDYWRAVTALNVFYPWGTFGPPELLLGTAVDSSWFEAFAQGSVPYAAALGVLLLAATALTRSPYWRPLCVLAAFVAFAGLTQTPFGYPPIVLFWVFLGSALQQTATIPLATGAIEPVPRWPAGRVPSTALAAKGPRSD